MIADITMPEMSDDRLAREILALRPDVPVILCTGYKKVSEAIALDLGAAALLFKPLVRGELAAAIR